MADAVTIRRATEADEAVLRSLWEEFEAEIPWDLEEPETWADEWPDTLDDINGGGVFIAEDADGPVGVARIEAPVRGRANVQLVHVRPRARRQGVATALLHECVADAKARGAKVISLEVLTSNVDAVNVWRRLGFTEATYLMAAELDVLEARLKHGPSGEQRATTHVQTDDETSVQRAVDQFVPRLEGADVSANGSWIRVSDPYFNRDREAQHRFARDLSDRLGAVTVALSQEGEVVRFRLYERGSMVDEYLSVPSYYGNVSKGDELALAANPTLAARLTGADREAVRGVARTAASPAELPPAGELYEQIARVLGLEP
ncbi:MAG TPA: GNAT family N-acetyltransferase [Gaiellaceae bacterium]|jgi:ribosomal protein S18 acetylase RimI-like enzyme|nr:GNAT family N-acetyltransferase [Gaiellaceae bacterium]